MLALFNEGWQIWVKILPIEQIHSFCLQRYLDCIFRRVSSQKHLKTENFPLFVNNCNDLGPDHLESIIFDIIKKNLWIILDRHQVWRSHDPMSLRIFLLWKWLSPFFHFASLCCSYLFSIFFKKDAIDWISFNSHPPSYMPSYVPRLNG